MSPPKPSTPRRTRDYVRATIVLIGLAAGVAAIMACMIYGVGIVAQ